jgi:hypothetical protein
MPAFRFAGATLGKTSLAFLSSFEATIADGTRFPKSHQ